MIQSLFLPLQQWGRYVYVEMIYLLLEYYSWTSIIILLGAAKGTISLTAPEYLLDRTVDRICWEWNLAIETHSKDSKSLQFLFGFPAVLERPIFHDRGKRPILLWIGLYSQDTSFSKRFGHSAKGGPFLQNISMKFILESEAVCWKSLRFWLKLLLVIICFFQNKLPNTIFWSVMGGTLFWLARSDWSIVSKQVALMETAATDSKDRESF
jgi:hypothetical protein